MKRLPSTLDVKTDRIYHPVGACKCIGHGPLVVNVGCDRLKLDAIRTENPCLRSCRTMRRRRNPVPPKTATVRSFMAAEARIRATHAGAVSTVPFRSSERHAYSPLSM